MHLPPAIDLYVKAEVRFVFGLEGDKTIVTSRLTGNFPGSPIEVRFVFRLDGDKIASLEIG